MQKLAIFLIIIWLALTGYAIYQHVEYVQVIDEQESKIESLQSSNAVLQRERDELYTEYVSVRDELWNLKNGMANN